MYLRDSGHGGHHCPLRRRIRVFMGRHRCSCRHCGCRGGGLWLPSFLFLFTSTTDFRTHNTPAFRQRPQALLRNALRHPNLSVRLIFRIFGIRQLLPYWWTARSVSRARAGASVDIGIGIGASVSVGVPHPRSKSKRHKRCPRTQHTTHQLFSSNTAHIKSRRNRHCSSALRMLHHRRAHNTAEAITYGGTARRNGRHICTPTTHRGLSWCDRWDLRRQRRLTRRRRRRRRWFSLRPLHLHLPLPLNRHPNFPSTIPPPIRMLKREHLRIRIQQPRQQTHTPRPPSCCSAASA